MLNCVHVYGIRRVQENARARAHTLVSDVLAASKFRVRARRSRPRLSRGDYKLKGRVKRTQVENTTEGGGEDAAAAV